MLKLIYDVRCGFKQLYMTETHLEYELDGLFLNLDEESFNGFKSAKDFYGYCKDLSQAELEDLFTDNGILGIIAEDKQIEYAQTYFKTLCYEKDRLTSAPGYIKIYNLRFDYDEDIMAKLEQVEDLNHNTFYEVHYYMHGQDVTDDFSDNFKYSIDRSMKASTVMSILGISRPTLCHYVKRGLIKIDKNYTGKQYRYDGASVMELLNKQRTC